MNAIPDDSFYRQCSFCPPGGTMVPVPAHGKAKSQFSYLQIVT